MRGSPAVVRTQPSFELEMRNYRVVSTSEEKDDDYSTDVMFEDEIPDDNSINSNSNSNNNSNSRPPVFMSLVHNSADQDSWSFKIRRFFSALTLIALLLWLGFFLFHQYLPVLGSTLHGDGGGGGNLQAFKVYNPRAFVNITSPQSRAYRWMESSKQPHYNGSDYTARYVLAVFFFSTSLANDKLYTTEGDQDSEIPITPSTWLTDVPVCDWKPGSFTLPTNTPTPLGEQPDGENKNIVCEAGELIRLKFVDTDLTGTMPAEVGLLTTLREISFSGNRFGGRIPSELGFLTQLTSIYLDSTFLHYPSTSDDDVEEKKQDEKPDNDHHRPIPSWLGKITKLEYLDLAHNGLTGTLPLEFTMQLSHLQFLTLKGNELHDTIPRAGVAHMTSLISLVLDHNQFYGSMQDDVCWSHLTSLQWLGWSNNMLEGQLTEETIRCLLPPSLKRLELAWNQFSGPLPSQIANATIALAQFDLSNNSFSGTIPSQWAHLDQLQKLLLSNNPGINGTIPEDFGASLIRFDVRNTGLTGTVPASVCHIDNNDDGLVPVYLECTDSLQCNQTSPPYCCSYPNIYGNLKTNCDN